MPEPILGPDAPIANPYLHFSDIGKEYPSGHGVPVVEGFDLRLTRGEFVSIIGHSGCGKSTVLMIAAGLSTASRGGVILESRLVDEPGTDRGVVFQSPSLFPWMTAVENVLLAVSQVRRSMPPAQRREICVRYLEKVGLGDSLQKRVSEMSVGMKQRVSIARAFALQPKLLLLDEPFGMLDSLTRAELQETLMEVWSSEKITAVMVTHDVDEALLLSDRIAMMTSGPRAKLGAVLTVPFERPRVRQQVVERPDYYAHRGALIDFLEGHHRAASEPRIVSKGRNAGEMTGFPRGASTQREAS